MPSYCLAGVGGYLEAISEGLIFLVLVVAAVVYIIYSFSQKK
jgi:hypothetical protein